MPQERITILSGEGRRKPLDQFEDGGKRETDDKCKVVQPSLALNGRATSTEFPEQNGGNESLHEMTKSIEMIAFSLEQLL
jgi:hypothetical protein